MKKLRIFIASPGDVKEERDIVSTVVDELRRTISEHINVEFETIRWETHAWPDVGEDAQDVINREIGEYDVLVGIMWKRFGTPTKRAPSGTGEEFERAYAYFKAYQRPQIMFYFRNTAFYTTDVGEISQFKKVIQFRKKLEKLGVLFWEYTEPIQFERRLREHLTKQVFRLTQKPETKPKAHAPVIFFSYAREDLYRVEPIYDAFKTAGFLPWMDVKDIKPGTLWKEEVEKVIRSADFFITFISRHTVRRQGFVQVEMSIALDTLQQAPDALLNVALHRLRQQPGSTTFILPVRLDPVEPPGPLGDIQWIDFFHSEETKELISLVRELSDRKRFGADY